MQDKEPNEDWYKEAEREFARKIEASDKQQQTTEGGFDPEIRKRVWAYLDRCDPAISGQRGHDTTFRVSCALVRGFGLSRSEALQALAYYNQKCVPAWSQEELEHKIDDAF